MNEYEGKYIQKKSNKYTTRQSEKRNACASEKMTEYFDGVCIESN